MSRMLIKLLTDAEIQTLHDRTLDVYEQVGIKITHPEVLGLLECRGARVTETSGIVQFDRALVRELLGLAPPVAVETGLNAYAFFTAEWCENCQEIEQSLKDAGMAHVFRGAYIMRLDLDVWADQARESGMFVVGVPAFYGIGADGRANGRAFIGGASSQDSTGRSITSLEDFFSASP